MRALHPDERQNPAHERKRERHERIGEARHLVPEREESDDYLARREEGMFPDHPLHLATIGHVVLYFVELPSSPSLAREPPEERVGLVLGVNIGGLLERDELGSREDVPAQERIRHPWREEHEPPAIDLVVSVCPRRDHRRHRED